jgi:very-short-patch-repair endonuclease
MDILINSNMKRIFERDRILKELGYLTLRFTDDEVHNHIQNVRRAIEQAIEERIKK